MANITPYIRDSYPTIEGNDRSYFDSEFRKIQECLSSVIKALVADTSSLTIATGVVIMPPASNPVRYLLADTEAAASTDDLVTISGGKEGQVLVVRAANSARTVVCKDGSGNMKLAGDMTLDNTEDTLTLAMSSSVWYEIGRSNSGA